MKARWLAAVVFLTVVEAMAVGVRPDYLAAAAFGQRLQKDYAERRTRAVSAGFDSEGMMRRVYARGIEDRPDFAGVRKEWESQLLPSIARQLEAYDSFETLLPARVILIEGGRALECVLLRHDGLFHLVTLLLTETAAGEIRIVDIQLSSALLEVSRALRHVMLLMRAPLPGILDDEEVALANLGRTHGPAISTALQTAGRGEMDAAFKLWSALPAELKTMRIWREHRNRMAFNGAAAAMRELRAEAQAGAGGPPIVRFSLALADKDAAGALMVLDDLLIAHRELPWLRVIKADLLLKNGRAAEALALARDICALGPLTHAAHAIGVQAAVRTSQTDTAVALLGAWSRLAPLAGIEQALATDDSPAMAAFRVSAPFAAWRRATAATAPAK